MPIINVTGIEECIARAEGLERDYLINVERDLRWFGEHVTARMREGHPPGGPHPGPPPDMPVFGQHAYIDRSGYLTRSIGFTVESWSSFHAAVVVFATSPYADVIEHGSPHSRPYPFFWPNFYAQVPYLVDRIRITVESVFRQYSEPGHEH
jgi:hypothetical protein